MITYDPNGGDLGRASIHPITALELQIIVPHVASILEELSVMFKELHYKYAFEISTRDRDGAQFVIDKFKQCLRPSVAWYECDGLTLFQVRGPSDGVVSSYVCYLITSR